MFCGVRVRSLLLIASWLLCVTAAAGQTGSARRIFMITDMEGVDGIFDSELQCVPNQSPRWEESRKLLTGEINAAVEGLLAGGATEVMVWDGHDSGQTLSVLDIHPKATLLLGRPISPTLELNSTYCAIVFIGQHARAGADKGILGHSYDSQGIQNIWVNGKLTGEIGGRVMLAGTFGIPAILVSGDAAACHEYLNLVPNGECAEVKSGVSRTAGYMLSHGAACELIRQKARRAMSRLAEYKPYQLSGPVEVKVEFTTRASQSYGPRDGVAQMDARTWAFRGRDIQDAWLKFSSF